LAVSNEWMQARPERAHVELGSNYGGINQRWLVVYTQSAHERAEQSVNRQLLKQGQIECKAYHSLSNRDFACVADAEAALAYLQSKLKAVTLETPTIIELPGFSKKGLPRKGQEPDTACYRVEAGVACALETRLRKIQCKSCFVIAINQLDVSLLSNDKMLELYTPGQQKVERGFRFLKDPWFMAHTLFLKSPRRIMALMMVMTLCLLVFGALEYRIRQALTKNKQSFPNQIGTTTAKPTARWVFQYFAGIHVLLINHKREVILNCNEYHHQLVCSLGQRYVKLYASLE
jgi:transposase